LRLSTFTVALVLALPLAAQRGDGPPRGRGPRPQASPVELKNFDFREVEFASKNLADGSGRMGVYLPKGAGDEANKDKTWPLVVWLHGFGGYEEFQWQGGSKTLDELRGKGEIPDVVFAAFEAPGGRRGRSVYVNGERSGKIEDAIVQDLIGHAVKELHASPDRAQHAIMGVSIGGFGALKIAMKHPDVFGAVAAHSSAIFADDPDKLPPQFQPQIARYMQMGLAEVFGNPIDKVKWAAEMPMGLARSAPKDAFAKLRIYFDAGTEDRYGFAAPNTELSKLMDERGIAHTYRLVEGGGHAWGSDSMLDNLRQSLRFVAAAFAGKDVESKPAATPAAEPARTGGDAGK